MKAEGKTFSILGDSYSTYKNYIPGDYEAWYMDEGPVASNDVSSVEQTWWYMFCREKQLTLLQNCSYSGSPVCNTWYDGMDASELSFIKRMNRELIPTQEHQPDFLIVFGGTNDFWAGCPIGRTQYEEWTKADLKKFAPAFCYMMTKLREWYPNIPIYNVVNDELSGEIKQIMKEVCDKFDITNIWLENIGKENGHPNQEGMRQIKEQICEGIFRRWNTACSDGNIKK